MKSFAFALALAAIAATVSAEVYFEEKFDGTSPAVGTPSAAWLDHHYYVTLDREEAVFSGSVRCGFPTFA